DPRPVVRSASNPEVEAASDDRRGGPASGRHAGCGLAPFGPRQEASPRRSCRDRQRAAARRRLSAAPPGKVSDSELAARIAAAAIELALPLKPEQTSRLVAYLRLIERWNETYNLTSIRDPSSMATQHIVDSLAAAAALRRRRAPRERRRLIDVGSGAGLPGVVVAVALPETEVVCVDCVGKKAAFITQAAGSLGARNITSLHA